MKKIKEQDDDSVSLSQWWRHVVRNSWFDEYIRIPWKNFIKGIRNIIKWMPIVWKDRDWDDYYIFKALRFKIKNTRDYIVDHDLIMDDTLENINRYASLSIKLIDRICDEYYMLEYLDYFESEFNWNKTDELKEETGETYYKLDIKELGNHADVYFQKYPRIYKLAIKKLKEKEKDTSDKKVIAMQMSYINHDRVNHLLFEILKEKMQQWWD